MSPEEIARLHQFRDGFTLVDYAEVGLPVFRLTIEAVTTSQRALPTIQEFVMRGLALADGQEAEVARLLGLGPEIVQGAVNVLVSDGLLSRQMGHSGNDAFKLTELGEKRLANERQEELREEMLVVDYDGIRRFPVRLVSSSVRRASELRSFGAIEIRPYPAEPPSISELSIPEISRVIRRQGGEDFRRTVLALKRVSRRSNVFREAVALVFASNSGSEIQIAFAIDGKLSEQHERAFAERGGPKKMGLIKAVSEGRTRQYLQRVVGREMVKSFPDPNELVEARRQHLAAESEVRSILPAAQYKKRSSAAAKALQEANEKLKVAEHSLLSMTTRPLACYEQQDLLDEAIANATHSLIITSAGVQPLLLNGFRLREIDRLCESGVDVHVETVLRTPTEPLKGDKFDPMFELVRRADQKKLSIGRHSRRSLFFLIQDNELAVVANRPFLGEVNRRSGFIKLDGLVTRSPQNVQQIRDALISHKSRTRT
ncbi:hypothetical protein I5192_15990 [Ruegeria sp. SCSIO 43209]|uniref:hypothetical protein n=1 Tax=Ruegeria sp. SCSIO 43209 TaxID=2793010 RepID=UPI001CA82B3B|nr:hypothetical protein [Ruegeria sp. SCSIO 43209]UAB88707.1 hypothetical protein I5192_15990 [Ruegeria sp. SCSIO 43209]